MGRSTTFILLFVRLLIVMSPTNGCEEEGRLGTVSHASGCGDSGKQHCSGCRRRDRRRGRTRRATHTHTHTHARTHARTHAHVTHTHTHVCTHTHARTHVTHTHTRTYARTHAHTHTHACTHTRLTHTHNNNNNNNNNNKHMERGRWRKNGISTGFECPCSQPWLLYLGGEEGCTQNNSKRKEQDVEAGGSRKGRRRKRVSSWTSASGLPQEV